MTSPWISPSLAHASDFDTNVENRFDTLDKIAFQVFAYAYAASVQQTINSAAWTVATYDTELIGGYTAGWNAFAGIYTIPSGVPANSVYLLFGTAYWVAHATTSIRRVRFVKNGTPIPGSCGPPHPNHATAPNVAAGWTLTIGSTGDQYAMEVYQNSGGARQTALAVSGGPAHGMGIAKVGWIGP
jgi:hypothetical protein